MGTGWGAATGLGVITARVVIVLLLVPLTLKSQAELSEAAALARAHQFAEAARILKGVAAPADPKQAIAFYRLHAAIDAGLHRNVEAAADMHAALRLAPGDVNLLRATAAADLALFQEHSKSGNEEKNAVLGGALAAKSVNDTAEIEALLGDLYEAVGDSVSSVHSYQEAVRLSPGQESFRISLAVELLQHQTIDPAIVGLKAAHRDFPESPRILAALALALYVDGQEAAGMEQLLEALRLDSGFRPAARYLGEIALHQAGAPDSRVVEALCRFADTTADPETNAACGSLEARRALTNAETTDWTVIRQRFAAAAQAAPNSVVVRCEYGKVLDQLHDWGEARTQLEACTVLDPQAIEPHYRLMRIYGMLGRRDLARKEAALHAKAEEHQKSDNEEREISVKRFLYTIHDR